MDAPFAGLEYDEVMDGLFDDGKRESPDFTLSDLQLSDLEP